MQFIGYRIDGFDPDDAIPISTGSTKDEAFRKAITRVLRLCDVHSSIAVQQRDDIPADDFARLTNLVDSFAVKHGLA